MAQLGLAYLGVGLVLAVVLVGTRRLLVVEGGLVIVLWPIWVPLALSQAPPAPVEDDVRARVRHLIERLAELEATRTAYREELAALQAAVEYREPRGR